MNLLISKALGFCKGVDRAYRLAMKTAAKGQPVYVLGSLVHNQKVIEELEQKGVKTIATLKDLPARLGGPDRAAGFLLISAHGASPEVHEKALATGLTVIDTTCPWVKKPQTGSR